MKLKLISVLLLLVTALGACANVDDNNQEGATGRNNVEPTRFNNTGEGMNNNRDYNMRRTSEREQERGQNMNQRNDQYHVAEEAADRITDEVDEVERAYVLTTNNNAYVAAGLDIDRNARNDRSDTDNNAGRNTQNNTGNMGNINNQNNNERFDDELSDEVKDEIADIVKSVDEDIDNVFVSTNPDFFDLTNNYADDVNRGQPVEGFFDQIGNMIERIFPQNR
ncbi:YhcN/YlaJ family sporulation lipoprotein [Virgibacillus sp. C22-A2]|uniref:YhcN/YlaJ family sporulation lipoprotein n=2 Tax=Virgibacillus tibetensis TaxID=3042313 RepID=A0ABU6KEH3_9BACI|nr:YhcN/YlaJ family sporulation lipoprotein [Virgibacillus sp. C22-A2]